MTTNTKFRSILRATAILGSSSLINIVVGMVSAKFAAVLIGPRGTGMMNLLQGLVAMVSLIATLGVGTALVRDGAYALAHEDLGGFAALRRAAWLLFWTVGGLAAAFMALFHVPLSRVMLGGAQYRDFVLLGAVMMLFGLADSLQRAVLNAYQRIGILAKATVWQCVLGAACSVGAIWFWREKGIGVALLCPAVLGWAISRAYLWRLEGPLPQAPLPEAIQWVSRLVRFGIPLTISMFLGSGVQTLLPTLVLHSLGRESVGYFGAAVIISTRYLLFVTSSMGQDYYPRLSAVSDRPAELSEAVNQQLRLVLLLVAPLILGMLALTPILVPLLYSSAYLPTVDVLEWQLIGDLFKMTSWMMGFVILARGSSKAVLFTETIGGGVTLAAAVVGMRLMGLEGLGVAFLVGYAAHCATVWWVVRRDIGFRLSQDNQQLLAAALAAALCVRLMPYIGLSGLRTAVALALALAAGAYSARTLRRDWRAAAPVPSTAAE
jgi:antigen flippase